MSDTERLEARDGLDPVVRAWRFGQEELLQKMASDARQARDNWAGSDRSDAQRMRDYWQNVATTLALQKPLPYPDNAAWDKPWWDGYATSVRVERAAVADAVLGVPASPKEQT